MPETLRGRYIYVSMFLFVILAFSAVFGWYSVQTAVDKHHHKMAAQASIESTVYELVLYYQDVKYSLLEFLVQPDEQNYQLYNDSVLNLTESFIELKNMQQLVNMPGFQKFSRILEKDLTMLKTKLRKLIRVRLDSRQTFPFTENMQDINAKNIQTLAALNNLLSLNLDAEYVQYDALHKLLDDGRYLWLRIMAEYRLLVVIRFGAFSEPWQPVFEQRVHDIEIFFKQIRPVLKKLDNIAKKKQYSIDVNAEILSLANNMRLAIEEYQNAIFLLRSPSWRQDLLLLTNELHPAFSRLDQSIQFLYQEKESGWRDSMDALTLVAQRLSGSLWLILMICSMMIIFGYFIFDQIILRPLRQVAQALNDEASGKTVELNDVNTAREIQVLTDAFHDMRKQVNSRQQRLVNILDNAAEAIITIDNECVIETFNVAAEQLFDYKVEEVQGKSVLMLLPEDEREYYQQLFMDYKQNSDIQLPDNQEGFEIYVLCNHHHLKPVSVKISKTLIDDQELYTGLVEDISERLANEKERQQRLAEMAHVGRLSIMGEMAAGIAHELNQPLAAMSLYLQGSLRRCDPDSKVCGAEMVKAVHSAIEQVDRASEIIRKMRGFARQETFHHELADLNEIIRKSVDLVLISYQSLSPEPELQLSEEGLMVKVDVLQIEQVLVNLIRNAFDAVSKIEVSKRSICIRSSLDSDGFARVFVIDSGEGVAKENISRIFDTYFTTKQDGLGMGLSICRSIIEAHDGVLWYREGTEEGAQFCFLLPAVQS